MSRPTTSRITTADRCWRTLAAATICLTISLALAIASPTHAQDDPMMVQQDFERDNAAYWYQRAYFGYRDLGFSNDEERMLADFADTSGPPSDAIRSLLQRLSGVVRDAMRGTEQDTIDYHLPFDDGFNMLMPHLSRSRTVGKILVADALVRLADQDSAAAAHRMAALYQMGHHGGRDDVMISSLVAMSLFNMAENVADRAFEQNGLTRADAQILLNATRALDTNDPFRVIPAIEMEKNMFVDFVRKAYDGEDGHLRLFDEFISFGANGDDERAKWEAYYKEHSFEEELDHCDALMNEFIGVFNMEDEDAARAELERLETELLNSEHGMLAKMMLPAYGRMFENMVKTRTALAERVAMLESIVSGETDMALLRNAAFDYIIAMDEYDRLTAEQRSMLADAASSTDFSPTPELIAILTKCAPILDRLHAASRLDRCSFAYLFNSDRPVLTPRHGVGFDGLYDLVETATRVAVAREQFASAATLIGTDLRMIRHIHNDESVIVCMRAAVAFRDIMSIAARCHADEHFDATAVADIAACIGAFDALDPHGIANALKLGADDLYGRYYAKAFELLNYAERPDEPNINASQEDRVLAHLVLNHLEREEWLTYGAEQTSNNAPPVIVELDPILQLDEVIDVDALEALLAEAPRCRSAFAEGNIDVFETETLPKITIAGSIKTSARNAIRSAAKLFPLPESNEDDTAGALSEIEH